MELNRVVSEFEVENGALGRLVAFSTRLYLLSIRSHIEDNL